MSPARFRPSGEITRRRPRHHRIDHPAVDPEPDETEIVHAIDPIGAATVVLRRD